MWEAVQAKLVFGENIAHTAQMVESGAAEVGIYSLAVYVGELLWLLPGALTPLLVHSSAAEPGRSRAKVVTIEVTSKGRLNLHKFDAKMQAQLEGYLVAVGILQKGQTLSAHEVPPEADAISSSPVIED